MQFRIRAARATSAHSNRAGLVAALFAAPYLAVPGNAVAQEKFPAKPVTVIVPFKTGQGVDVMAVFVGPGSAYKTLKELIAAAQAQPGSTNWGTTGVGSVPHLSGAAMLQAAKLAATHVPFRGEPQMLQQLLVNEITFAAASVSGMAGKGVRALAVFSDQRHTAFPDVPTMAELGYPAGVPGLNGRFVPRGTPEPMVAALEKACADATASDGFNTSASRLHQRVAYLGRSDFDRRLRNDFNEKARLIQSLNLKAE